jgi:hypothetical protein
VHDDRGQQTDIVTSSEINDFSAAALAACELVIDTSTDSRRIAELSWHLNRLQPRHALGALGGASLGDDRRLLRATLKPVGGGRWQIDYEQIRDVIGRQPATAIWDIELHADDRRMFVARWEDVPGGSEFIEFEETLLSSWLAEEVVSAT